MEYLSVCYSELRLVQQMQLIALIIVILSQCDFDHASPNACANLYGGKANANWVDSSRYGNPVVRRFHCYNSEL